MADKLIRITETAQKYLCEMISLQDGQSTGFRIFIEEPGTLHAECAMDYCSSNEQGSKDRFYEYAGFHVMVEARDADYLKGAVIDFRSNAAGGGLVFHAPNLWTLDVRSDASLEERVAHVLAVEINPGLAAHGGSVRLLNLTRENVAVLEFEGGCQGCSAVGITLGLRVKRILMACLPELTGVNDKTDHTVTRNAYYKYK